MDQSAAGFREYVPTQLDWLLPLDDGRNFVSEAEDKVKDLRTTLTNANQELDQLDPISHGHKIRRIALDTLTKVDIFCDEYGAILQNHVNVDLSNATFDELGTSAKVFIVDVKRQELERHIIFLRLRVALDTLLGRI